MFGLITRRRHADELAAARAEAGRLRIQRDKAIKAKETAEFTRERILHQYNEVNEKHTAVCLVNERLTEDLAAARAEASDSLAGQLRAELKREKRRADQLQKQYDEATTLADPRLENGRNWQQTRQDDGRKQATL